MFLFQQRVPFCFSTLGNRKVFSLLTFLSPAPCLVPSTWCVQRKCMVTARWAHRAKRLFSKGRVFSWIPLAAGCDTRNVEVMCVMLPGSTYSKARQWDGEGQGKVQGPAVDRSPLWATGAQRHRAAHSHQNLTGKQLGNSAQATHWCLSPSSGCPLSECPQSSLPGKRGEEQLSSGCSMSPCLCAHHTSEQFALEGTGPDGPSSHAAYNTNHYHFQQRGMVQIGFLSSVSIPGSVKAGKKARFILKSPEKSFRCQILRRVFRRSKPQLLWKQTFRPYSHLISSISLEFSPPMAINTYSIIQWSMDTKFKFLS